MENKMTQPNVQDLFSKSEIEPKLDYQDKLQELRKIRDMLVEKKRRELEEATRNQLPSEEITQSLTQINKEFRQFANDILGDEKNN